MPKEIDLPHMIIITQTHSSKLRLNANSIITNINNL